MYAVLGNRSIKEDVLSATMCLVEQTLNAKPLTPVSLDLNDLNLLLQTPSCLATKMFVYHTYHAQKSLLIIESSSDKHKRTPISSGRGLWWSSLQYYQWTKMFSRRKTGPAMLELSSLSLRRRDNRNKTLCCPNHLVVIIIVLVTVCHVIKKRKGGNNNVAAAENGWNYKSAKYCKKLS